MKQRYDQIIRDLARALERLPRRAAAVAALFVLAVGFLFAGAPDALRTGAATAALPQSAPAAEQQRPAPETPEQRFAARVGITHEAIDLSTGTLDARKLAPLPAEKLSGLDGETLWLARAVYSETKRVDEMELVAWAIRNRVETGYRGKRTYRDVVLDPWQFSAFNHNSGKRGYFTGLTPQSKADKWQEALTVAHVVRNAPEALRPFSQTTRHYYSERSMVGRSQPAWAVGERPISPERPYQVEARRFRFYENVA